MGGQKVLRRVKEDADECVVNNYAKGNQGGIRPLSDQIQRWRYPYQIS